MIAQFKDIHAAADYIGPGVVEVPQYQSEITDIVRRRGVFGQRVSRFRLRGILHVFLKRLEFHLLRPQLGSSIHATSLLRW